MNMSNKKTRSQRFFQFVTFIFAWILPKLSFFARNLLIYVSGLYDYINLHPVT